MKLPEISRNTTAAPPAGRPRTNAYRVLIVDDQLQNRVILQQILTRVGYEVETVKDGAEALKRTVCQPRPDLIVTDVEMPAMDGIDLVRAVRRLPEAIGRIPVVAASGSLDTGLQREMLLAGADAFVAKPIDIPQLLETVGRLIRESCGRGGPAPLQARKVS